MNNLKKRDIIIILLVLAIAMLAGCIWKDKKLSTDVKKVQEKKGMLNETGFPLVNEPITLRSASAKGPVHAEWNSMLVWKEYEKKTNIHMQWEMAPQQNFIERKNLILASGVYPDLFYRGMLSVDDESTYGAQGVFLDLNPLIDKYGPNIKQLFEKNPEYKQRMEQIDGKIYAIGNVIDYLAPRVSKGWINTKWLEKTGLPMPTTIDEYYNVLKAMKAIDYNGNGKPDEIPLSGCKDWLDQMFVELEGAWGLGTKGLGCAINNIDIGPDGKIRFIATEPRYKEMLQFMSKLWNEELMDKEIFTQNSNGMMAKGDQNIIGSWLQTNNPSVIGKNFGDYTTIPALQGPHGDRIWAAISPATSTGAFAITNKNKYPEATMRWVDYFFCDEGVRFLRMGVEGVTYRTLPNGEVEYMDDISKNPNGLTMDQAVGQFSPTPGGYIPQILMQKYDKGHTGSPVVVQGAKLLEPYIVKEVWSPKLTKEEEQELREVSNNINTYVKEMRIKFITGAESFSNWENYVNKIKEMGVKDIIKIWAASYERWNKQK